MTTETVPAPHESPIPNTSAAVQDFDNPQKPAAFLLEPALPLSDSILWKIQRSYYERLGVDAWRKGLIPHYVTSNAWVAHQYALLVLGFLRDIANALPAVTQVQIIELGAGSGRFSFHFLKKFMAMHAQSSVSHVKVRLIMTDLADRNIEFWRKHPSLASFVASGLLDFARFDVENPAPLHLINTNEILGPASGSPVIVFANYVFDTVKCDLFSEENGNLYEERVVLKGPEPNPNFDEEKLINKLTIEFERRMVVEPPYGGSAMDMILAGYRQELSNTMFSVPTGATSCLTWLTGLGDGQLFAVVADRGHCTLEAMIDEPGPALVVHDGCFSLLVNFHALGRWVELNGGVALHPANRSIDLTLSCFALGLPAPQLRETRLAFSQTALLRGPETFHRLKTTLDKSFENLDIDYVLAMMRLCEWDASPFMSALPHIVAKLPSASPATQRELQWTIHNVWNNYYTLGEPNDLAFNMAGLLYEMGCYPEAATYLQHSLDVYGPDPGTIFNLARCAFRLRRFTEALDLTNHALSLDPNLSAARVMRTRLLGELNIHGESVYG